MRVIVPTVKLLPSRLITLLPLFASDAVLMTAAVGLPAVPTEMFSVAPVVVPRENPLIARVVLGAVVLSVRAAPSATVNPPPPVLLVGSAIVPACTVVDPP